MEKYTINERDIAAKAEQMLTSALRSKTSGFADHVNPNKKKKSLKEAFAVSRIKETSSGQVYLRSVVLKMERHGFIRHFGVDKVRAAGSRTRTKPHNTTYFFKSHLMKQDAKPFLDAAIESSRVVPFVLEKVTESRSAVVANEIFLALKNYK